MSKRMIAAVAATVVAAGLAMTQAALAQEFKVGVILPYTGVGAELAQQIDRDMELYLKLNADQVKPYTITLVKRDSKAPDGAAAKIAVAGIADPGQGRRAGRLGLFARRHCIGTGRQCRQEAGGDHWPSSDLFRGSGPATHACPTKAWIRGPSPRMTRMAGGRSSWPGLARPPTPLTAPSQGHGYASQARA